MYSSVDDIFGLLLMVLMDLVVDGWTKALHSVAVVELLAIASNKENEVNFIFIYIISGFHYQRFRCVFRFFSLSVVCWNDA